MRRWQVTARLLPYLKRVWIPFSVSLVLLFLIAGLTAAKAWIIQPVVDTFLGGAAGQRDLVLLCLLVAGIFVSQAVLNWLYAVVARVASANIVKELRENLFRHLSRLSLGYFSERPSGDLASRVVNDVTIFENAAVNALQDLLRDFATVGFLIAVLVSKDWRLALTCLGIVAVVGLVLRRMSARIAMLSRRVQEVVSKLNQQLTEMIGGMEVILGFGLSTKWSGRFEKVTSEHYGMQMRATRASASAVLLVLLIVGGGVTGILFVTGRSLLNGNISAGDFGTFLAAIYLMQSPALTVSNSVSKLARGMAAAGRAVELLEDTPKIVEPERPERLVAGGLGVEFEKVWFRYRGGEAVLQDVTFSIRPGQLVVMVGDSGSGKSTAARLALRFYDPDEGEVRVGGVSLRSLPKEEIYRNVSFVSQDIFLFDDTIDFNLRIAKPQASADELDEALRVACLDQFLTTLPDGLRTRVGERGVRLSGGQRQRIAIARAVLSEARILVLDEATSALDMDLEKRLLENLVHSRRTRTLFAVTHRLSLAEVADRILVLKAGRLVEAGTARELAAGDGEFCRLKRASEASLVRPADAAIEPRADELAQRRA